MRPFRFGLQLGRVTDRVGWLQLAQRAEDEGYAALLIPDHVGRFSTVPSLMAAAAATRTIGLATYVLNQDFRPPAVLAQEAATVQVLTGGRLVLGLGAGWARREYAQTGLRFDPGPERVDRFDEYVQVVKGLLGAQAPYSYAGRWFTLDQYPAFGWLEGRVPPPILIGGGSPRLLGIGGRLADIVSVATRATPDGRVDARNITRAALEAKLGFIRQAAGDRFRAIELNLTIREVRITDDRPAAARQLLREWASVPQRMAHVDQLTEDDVLESPYLAIGTIEQVAQQLHTTRQRWGFAYFQVGSEDIDAFAPVLRRCREEGATHP